jgi:hypothetical protein
MLNKIYEYRNNGEHCIFRRKILMNRINRNSKIIQFIVFIFYKVSAFQSFYQLFNFVNNYAYNIKQYNFFHIHIYFL